MSRLKRPKRKYTNIEILTQITKNTNITRAPPHSNKEIKIRVLCVYINGR